MLKERRDKAQQAYEDHKRLQREDRCVRGVSVAAAAMQRKFDAGCLGDAQIGAFSDDLGFHIGCIHAQGVVCLTSLGVRGAE